MNVKIFFVKNAKEYIILPFEVVSNLTPETLQNFNFPDEMYRRVVQKHHAKINSNLDELYGGELFGETEIENLKIDFNFGLRLDIPRGNFHAKISDFDSGTIFFDEDVSDCRLISAEYYFIRWKVEIFLNGEKIFEHVLDLENQKVLIVFPIPAMGDILAMLPYVREFQKVHGCKIFLWLPKYLREVTKNFLPEIEQVEKISHDYYATYFMVGVQGDVISLPLDTRTICLDKVGGEILGLQNYLPEKLKFTPTQERKIPEKYVCIAVQGSGTPKGWHYPKGWEIVCDYLKKLGYRVLCIDKNKIENDFGYKNQKPKGAENFTGNIPLLDRANMLYYADFFIGLSSGLSWLANAVGCEVIMICGFSQDKYEFETPYRVANRFVCNGCFNDVTIPPFNAKSACVYHSKTSRELECQKKISPRQVINAIDDLIADKNLGSD